MIYRVVHVIHKVSLWTVGASRTATLVSAPGQTGAVTAPGMAQGKL